MRALITTSRRALTAVWVVLLVSLIGLAAWSHLASLIVVAGSSMEPAVPRGALIGPAMVPASRIAVGDVVTVRADNGVIITHRVTRVVQIPEGRFFELKGDANESPDPELVPERAVMGRVDLQVPQAGYVLAMLSMPSGLVFLLGALGAMLVGIWLLEELEAALPRPVPHHAKAKVAHGASA